MSGKLLKSGAIVSAMTLISRVLGLARDVVIANLMGAGAGADVFFFANKIPNFLRRLFAEGAFSQAFVPVLAEYQKKDDDEASGQADGPGPQMRELIARVSGTLGVLISLVTLVAVLASPVIAALFGFGWFMDWYQGEPDGAKFLLAADLLKITFPYLWFITLTALSGAVLNTLGRFSVAAFTPVLLNVFIISCALWLAPQLSEPEFGLAIGVFIGGLAQFLFQLPFLRRAGVLVRPKWGWRHPGVARIRTLMIPALFGVSVSQINLLLDTFIASFLVTGSISWLYYSDRLLEFPLGLFGIAIATVILPALSRRHAAANSQAFAHTLDWGVRMVCLMGIPAALGLITLAEPMLMVLFMRGEFSAADTLNASYSLFAYGSGLLSFMLVKVLAPGYYARQDTKTPVRIGIYAMVANMGLNILLVFPLGYIGLALATSLSATMNAALLYRGLAKQGVFHISRQTLLFVLRVALATGVMVAALLWLSPERSAWIEAGLLSRAGWLGGLIGAGALVYLLSAMVLGIRPRHLKAGAHTPA